MDFSQLREEVWRANVQLPPFRLVVMHSGNASGIDRKTGLVLIKPSGVDYDSLKPGDLAIVNQAGERVAAADVPDGVSTHLRPSVDTPHHLALYRADPEIGSVIHTHSNFATAWGTTAGPLPCMLSAIADEFGGEIPCTPYIPNEGDAIGEAILKLRTRAPAILLANHGVFAFGATPRAALKAATMVEDAAKTVWLAAQLGELRPLAGDEIEKCWTRYHATYGQADR